MKSSFTRFAAVALTFLATFVSGANLQAQNRSLSRFAVDLVTLKSGERLRGAFMGRDAKGIVSMAVQREWLKQNEPKYLEALLAAEKESALAADQELIQRNEKWIAQNPKQDLLIAFLKGEIDESKDRIQTINKTGVDAQFVVVRFPDNRIRSKYSQQPSNRKIALLAWQESYKDVETREAEDLAKALDQDGLELDKEVVNLSSRLPIKRQSDREWAARQAIVEFAFGEQLEYQGTGTALFRTGKEQQIDLAKVLPQLLQNTLKTQLGGLEDLLNEPGLNGRRPAANRANARPDFTKQIAEATKMGVRGFRVTSLDLNPTAGRAAVTGQFVARMPNGKWETIWESTITEDATKARPGAEFQIKNDPQLKQLTSLLNGLDGGLDGQLNTAIRFGGATMEAQKKADTKFFEFRDKYMRRLSSPTISVPAARP